MDPKLPEELRDDAWRRAAAGFLLQTYLAGRRLPAHIRDVPDRMIVDRIARMDAKELLDSLRELYNIPHWNRETFERAFVQGSLDGWKPGGLIQDSPGRLRVVSTTCPIAAEVEKDSRLCEACRGIQKHAAYLALIGQVESVEFDRLMSKGESECEMTVRFRPARRVPP